MKWQKESFYALLFYGIALGIFAFGVLPVAQILLPREALSPEDYLTLEVEVCHILPEEGDQPQEVTVAFTLEGQEHQVVLPFALDQPELGQRLSLSVSRSQPEDIQNIPYLWGQFILFLGFIFLSVFTGLLMARPFQPYVPRPRRSLAERLKRY